MDPRVSWREKFIAIVLRARSQPEARLVLSVMIVVLLWQARGALSAPVGGTTGSLTSPGRRSSTAFARPILGTGRSLLLSP